MAQRQVPVYSFCGFLDSGKTSFIKPLVMSDDFTEDEKTLMIITEEGEEEYDIEALKKNNVFVEIIEDEEDFNAETLTELDEKHDPTQVVVEFNGMWMMETLQDAVMGTDDWFVPQLITNVDAGTFEMYSKNMAQHMMQHIGAATMVIFNRCTEELADMLRARNMKMLNRRADMFLEFGPEKMEVYDDGTPPFDLDQPVLDLSDDDYGVWFSDMMENTERYVDKEISFLGMVARSGDSKKDYCGIGRFAMVCCADDTQFLGLLMKGVQTRRLENGQWVHVRGKLMIENNTLYKGEGPVLQIIKVTPAEKPEDDLIYF